MAEPITPLTQAQGAALAGLSLRHFQRLLAEPGAPPRLENAIGRQSGLPVEPFAKWLRSRIASELGADENLSPQAERARLDRARANLAEQEYARRYRELIPRDEVAQAWSEQVTIAKNRLLSLPSRVSSDVLRLKTQRAIENALKDAVIQILTELSNDPVHP